MCGPGEKTLEVAAAGWHAAALASKWPAQPFPAPSPVHTPTPDLGQEGGERNSSLGGMADHPLWEQRDRLQLGHSPRSGLLALVHWAAGVGAVTECELRAWGPGAGGMAQPWS